MKKQISLIFCIMLLVLCVSGCQQQKTVLEQTTQGGDSSQRETSEGTNAATETTQIYLNGHPVTLNEEGNTDLSLLSVEKGITVEVIKQGDEIVSVNGENVEDSVHLDISAITREDSIKIDITNGDTVTSHAVNLMPSSFPDYTTEGESTTEGDFYLSTYDLPTNYIFKLNNSGELIFYKAITKIDEQGNEVSVNGLDFRKEYTSDGQVRYTYMPYLQAAFADGEIAGINPGCVRVMDENYNIVDEIYYLDENGNEMLIDPHGFIWLDENHYIVTAYKQEILPVPEDLNAVDNSADVAVLYIQEVKDGEVLWEFKSSDYEEFLYETNMLYYSSSTEVCYDYVHFNSMHIDKDDNLLVSCRHLDAIIKISRQDGSLMWQLGGDYDDFGLTKDQLFSYQHSIVVTDDGDYVLFDNANTAVEDGDAQYSSVIRMSVDEEAKKVTDFVRHTVVDFYSNYMGAIRVVDNQNKIYLYSVGGNYLTDTETPPEWSMVEYTETAEGEIVHNFNFRFNEGSRKLYAANKCK